MADHHRRYPRHEPRHEPRREPRRENFYSLDRDYRDHGSRRPRAHSPDYKRSRSLDPYSRHQEPPRSSTRDVHRRRNYSPSPDRRQYRHSTPSHHYPSSNRHPERHSRGRHDSPPLKHSPRRSSEHKEHHRSKSAPRKDELLGQAAKAALDAAAIEAIRVRHHPGPWAGTKGARVATAAVGAAIIDRGMGRARPEERSTRHMIQSAIGGLAATSLLNGARKGNKGR
ncbi:unnamed protein product [Clonostachys rosea]|uniref:DUF3824 domain-containing protein n=1 Tax=Bionectria ochroleuca TaxID=29856 RepID=A0ABY6USR0_BIOOC|nr:unnamed protein product [Clonostachys rosea]